MRTTRLLTTAAAAVALVTAVTACGGSAQPTAAGTTNITFTDASCGGHWHAPRPGWHTFEINNQASAGAEVDLINPANGAIYDELENDGPGTTTPMSLDLGSGQYAFLCLISEVDPFAGPTVTVAGHAKGTSAILPITYNDMVPLEKADHAETAAGLAVLAKQVRTLAADVSGGNLAQAKKDWLTAHLQYESLGVAYTSFGQYDGEIDGRADAVGTNSRQWTGFYRLEYGLWHGQSAAELTPVANTLSADVGRLITWWQSQEVEPLDLALRTHEVLENALEFQLSGHDDYGSGTTLATTLANISATRYLLSLLHPLLASRYPRLGSVYTGLSSLQDLIEKQRSPNGSWLAVSALPAATRAQIDGACDQVLAELAPIASIAEPRNTAHDY